MASRPHLRGSNRFYDQVKVGTDAKTADPNCDLLGIRGDAPQPTCTLPSPDEQCMFVLRIGRLTHCFDGIGSELCRNTTNTN